MIGGGPAGSTAARCLASWGRRVVLLSRPVAGPSIAESLPPSCLPLLDRIVVRDAIERAGFVRATGNTIWWGDGAGDARVERFPAHAPGFQVDRHVFDALLLREAAAAGATVRTHALVRNVIRRTDGSVVRFDAEDGPHEIDARWVLDCTGRSGLTARHGWRRAESGARTLALIGLWDAIDGWGLDDESHTLVESSPSGWAWSVPVSTRRRCVTVMVDPTIASIGGRQELNETYRTELAGARHLDRLVRRASLVDAPWARDASPYSFTTVCDDGLLLVGDSASFVDPLSSFGVKKALASAWLAAVVVNTALAERGMMPHALDLYERRERAMYDSLCRTSSALAREAAAAHGTSFWQGRALDDVGELGADVDVASLREDPDVLHAFAEIRRLPSLHVRRSPDVRERDRPTVRGNRIVLEPHLVTPAFGDGVRYVRNVDLIMLAELAVTREHVPDLFEAYNRTTAPVSLPDLLGALSVLVGKGVLQHDGC